MASHREGREGAEGEREGESLITEEETGSLTSANFWGPSLRRPIEILDEIICPVTSVYSVPTQVMFFTVCLYYYVE